MTKLRYKLNEAEYAEMYRVTPRQVRYWKAEGKPLDDPGALAEILNAQKNKPKGFADKQAEENPQSQSARLGDAKLEKVILECKKLAFRLDVEKGLYTLNEDVRVKLLELLNETKAELRKAFENELPPKCEGLSAADIQTKNREGLDRVLGKLTRGTDKISEVKVVIEQEAA